MDKRLAQKLDKYLIDFKDSIKNELLKLDGFKNDNDNKSAFLEFLYGYDKIEITRNDFMKRKRVKNTIPEDNRCNAKKAGGNQCTRRRKENSLYCGTHVKGAPHGEINEGDSNLNEKKCVVINAKEINGIIYYTDDYGNVYKMEDIMSDVENPEVIGKYFNKNNDEIDIILNNVCQTIS